MYCCHFADVDNDMVLLPSTVAVHHVPCGEKVTDNELLGISVDNVSKVFHRFDLGDTSTLVTSAAVAGHCDIDSRFVILWGGCLMSLCCGCLGFCFLFRETELYF